MNIFVSGTDTGIGKTVVSAILALKLDYRYWKPMQSGLDGLTDSQWVAQKIGQDRIQQEVYRFRQPLSPHLASRIDEVQIDVKSILSAVPSHKTIIEGAGGLLVPMTNDFLLIDLIRQLECPLILVARSGLGTINHTLLSLEALGRRGISRIGVIMVGDLNHENKLAIERFGKVPVLGEIPKLAKLDREDLLAVGARIQMEKMIWK